MRTLFFVGPLVVIATLAHASLVTPPTKTLEQTLTTLAARYPLIVVGTVGEASDAYYGTHPAFPGGEKIILTDHSIAVEQVVKGALRESTLFVQIPEGCVNDLCFHTDVETFLPEGKQVILFLAPGQVGKWVIPDPISGIQRGSDLGVLQEIIRRGVK